MFNAEDIVGNHYGKWKVSEYRGKHGKEQVYHCVCSCGNEKDVIRRSLLSGRSKSCGCTRHEPKSDRENIVGNKYGRLTVLEFSHSTAKGLYYKCQCECGNIVVLQKSHLLHYPNITCGDCPKVVEEDNYLRYICANGDSFIFDREDITTVMDHRWCIGDGYVQCVRNGKLTKLSCLLMNPPRNMVVDHVNGDTRDNRRENLRVASSTENGGNAVLYKNNSSGYKGVSFNKERMKYTASIQCNRKQHYLGAFKTPEEAARAYDEAARFYFGEFACVNFPLPGEQCCRRNQPEAV